MSFCSGETKGKIDLDVMRMYHHYPEDYVLYFVLSRAENAILSKNTTNYNKKYDMLLANAMKYRLLKGL